MAKNMRKASTINAIMYENAANVNAIFELLHTSVFCLLREDINEYF